MDHYHTTSERYLGYQPFVLHQNSIFNFSDSPRKNLKQVLYVSSKNKGTLGHSLISPEGLSLSPSAPLPHTPTHVCMLQIQFLSNSWHSTFFNASTVTLPSLPRMPFSLLLQLENFYSSFKVPFKWDFLMLSLGFLFPLLASYCTFYMHFMSRICQNSLERGHTVQVVKRMSSGANCFGSDPCCATYYLYKLNHYLLPLTLKFSHPKMAIITLPNSWVHFRNQTFGGR